MRRLFIVILPAVLLAMTGSASAATGKVVKVLPHFLDLKGRHALSPSLYDRDAYQVLLRNHPELRSGMRFDISWRASGAANATLKLRVELRGVAEGNLPRQQILEKDIQVGKTSHWTSVTLEGDPYKNLGKVTAWRATLWDGDQLLGEQKSFLW